MVKQDTLRTCTCAFIKKTYFFQSSFGVIDVNKCHKEINSLVYDHLLGDPELTANIYCKSRNLPNKGTQNISTDLR